MPTLFGFVSVIFIVLLLIKIGKELYKEFRIYKEETRHKEEWVKSHLLAEDDNYFKWR
jgi:hypothetical protein